MFVPEQSPVPEKGDLYLVNDFMVLTSVSHLGFLSIYYSCSSTVKVIRTDLSLRRSTFRTQRPIVSVHFSVSSCDLCARNIDL
ncbi:unnamed protein product, partial [Porites evermanni]